MLENRVKISSIVRNQLPEFVKADYPLVEEFLSQYYVSLEEKSNPSDIIQNIDQYVKVDYLTNLIESTNLTSSVNWYDSEIFVESTYGFPERNGLIMIGNEIILYKEKNDTSFLNCTRGFSGISSYENKSSDELIFKSTFAEDHTIASEVINLNILFLKQFFKKLKSQITPGIETNDLYQDLNENLFIKQSNDFYKSKGTENSFKILFGALYGSPAKVILPRDYLIQPSDAQYRITQDLVVESISGNPEDLINSTLYQDETSIYSYARGTISSIERIVRDGRNYFKISLDSGYDKDIDVFGSLKSNFRIHPKTIITSELVENSTYIDVDSTIGFPNSGNLLVDVITKVNGEELVTTLNITYTSKVLNQFLGCQGIDLPDSVSSTKGLEIKTPDFCYGFAPDGNLVTLRITGVNTELDTPDSSAYYKKDDPLKIKTLGEDSKRFKDNNWFFNVSTVYSVKEYTNVSPNVFRVVLFDDHKFVIGDLVDLINQGLDEEEDIIVEGTVLSIENSKIITIRSNETIVNLYEIRKKLSKFNSSDNSLNVYNTNVQNTFVDYEGNTYVASPSLPSYLEREIKIQDFSHTFEQQPDITETYELKITNHNYYTGDSVIFASSSDKVVEFDGSKINKFLCYVKKVDNNTISLSNSRENIFKSQFIRIVGNISGSKINLSKFVDRSFSSLNLRPQNIFKKLEEPSNFLVGENKDTSPGTTGIFINGVELLNYKSVDKVFYGPIEDIVVTSSGTGYNLDAPLQLQILDENGRDAVAYCAVKGQLERVDIINPGFDYIDDPRISIRGGNGSGAEVGARVSYFEHFSEFDGGQVISNNIIEFYEDHLFKNAEEVIYNSNQQVLVGGIQSGSYYYVQIVDNKRIKLHNSETDALDKINEISLSSGGTGVQRFNLSKKKKRISSIEIISPGQDYQNKKTYVSGVNSSSDTLIIKNHGYLNGEIIVYYPESVEISGLTSSKSYYVTNVNDNEIKLSEIGPENNKDIFYKEKKYVNIRTNSISGKNYFNYEPITVVIEGSVGIADSSAYAEVRPVFKGSIESVSIENGGVGYGSSEIINLNKQPIFMLVGGSGAQISPVIENGRIVDAIILSPGLKYESFPDLVVNGDGQGAILTPIFSNGSISEVKVISGGIGYTKEKTKIFVGYSGQNAKFEAIIKDWNVNLFERNYLLQKGMTDDDGFIHNGLSGLQYTHLYPSRDFRKSIYTKNYTTDLQLVNGREFIRSTEHSPLIGWAYDGNPIYGPYGYSSLESGEVKIIESGYQKKSIRNIPDRPSVDIYPLGFFVEDFEYIGSGDLDEYNGRYCVTPEFPNGIYAYFSTFENRISTNGSFRFYLKPKFPYVIGNQYKNRPIQFNFNPPSFIDENYILNNKLLRNTSPYNLLNSNSGYEFLYNPNKIKEQNIKIKYTNSGTIDRIHVVDGGSGYKVGDTVILNDNTVGGAVSKVIGKNISSITSYSESQYFEFIPYNSKFIGVSTNPHNFYNATYGTLTSNYEYQKYGTINVIESSLVIQDNINSPNLTGEVANIKIYGGDSLEFPVTENDYYDINGEIVKVLNINSKSSEIRILREQFGTNGVAHSAGSLLKSLPRKVIFDLDTFSNNYSLKLNREYYFDPSLSVGLGLTDGVGISSSLFFSVIPNNTPVTLTRGTQTTIIFDNLQDISPYQLGGYIQITNASNTNWNIDKTKIVSIGLTSITVDFNSSLLANTTVSAKISKWKFIDIPTKAIYLPNHNIVDGDSLIYNSNTGNPISVSIDGVSSFTLQNNSILYATKISNDLIGLSTERDISNTLYFSGLGTKSYHSLANNYRNIFYGNLEQNITTVSTVQNHNLSLYDIVDLDVKVGIAKTFKLYYNSINRRFVVDKREIENVDVDENTIFVSNHNFKTGDKLIYEANSPIGGLTNNSIYYAVIVDKNILKLSSYYSDSKKLIPIVINLTSSGTGTLSPINPEIRILKYQDIIFDVSDPSLASGGQPAFDLKFYNDENFNNEYLSTNIVRSGIVGVETTSTVIIKSENIKENIYYSLIPNKKNKKITNNQKNIFIDKEQNNNNKIILDSSVLNTTHKIIALTNDTFTFNTINTPINPVYDGSNSTSRYITNSKTASGTISSIYIKNKNKTYSSLPYVKEIKSDSGTNAVVDIESTNIGRVSNDNIFIDDYGFNYSIDRTVRPKYKFPDILKLSPRYIFDRIEIISNGKYYISPPNLVAIDSIDGSLIDDAIFYYDFDNSQVIILKNTQGISKFEPIILPVDNDNGIPIKFIEYDELSGNATVTLDAEFNDLVQFPFEVGDLVIIEDVFVEDTGGKGYNSSVYNYKPFVVNFVDDNNGGYGGTITFKLSDYLLPEEFPGVYDNRIVQGKIVPQKYFPQFKSYLKTIDFLTNEVVKTKSNSGIVVGWDSDNNILRVSTDNEFKLGDLIVGQTSNIKGEILEIYSLENYINVDSNITVNSGFKKETGFLNNNEQRIHDNDYYQYFSYSVDSEVDFTIWSDEVDRLNHTSGFKKFSNLNVNKFTDQSRISEFQGLGTVFSESLSPEVINYNCYHDFDLVTENSFIISNKLKSNEVYFESRIISDYIESKGNRVLIIDDISDKFTTSERIPYQIIDEFEMLDIRFKKYFIHIYDVLDPSRTEFSILTLLNDKVDGYINNYAIISSEDSIGYYDYVTELDRFGQLVYYPTITDRKIYKFNIFSLDISDSFVGIASTSISIGDIATISKVSDLKIEDSLDPISIVGVTSDSQIACKYLITISDVNNNYYESYEINALNINGTSVISEYGDISNSNNNFDVETKLVTFESTIVNDNLVLNIIPTQVSIGASFNVNAVITSISSTNILGETINLNGNLLQSVIVSNVASGAPPEKSLVFSYSNDFKSSYNLMVIKDLTNNEVEFLELSTLLNNVNQQSFVVEYGNLNSTNSIGVFESEISDLTGEYELYFTPYQDIDYEIRILKTIIGTEEQSGTTVI